MKTSFQNFLITAMVQTYGVASGYEDRKHKESEITPAMVKRAVGKALENLFGCPSNMDEGGRSFKVKATGVLSCTNVDGVF